MGIATFWGAYVVAALIAFLVWYRLCGRFQSPILRDLARTVVFAALVAPAPVPGYTDHYAPAWVVVGIEALLQRDGDPLPAATLLLVVVVALLAVVALWRYLRSGRTAD